MKFCTVYMGVDGVNLIQNAKFSISDDMSSQIFSRIEGTSHHDLIFVLGNWLKFEESHISCLKTCFSAQNRTLLHFNGFTQSNKNYIHKFFRHLICLTNCSAATLLVDRFRFHSCQNVPNNMLPSLEVV